jgi:hypothetical protein
MATAVQDDERLKKAKAILAANRPQPQTIDVMGPETSTYKPTDYDVNATTNDIPQPAQVAVQRPQVLPDQQRQAPSVQSAGPIEANPYLKSQQLEAQARPPAPPQGLGRQLLGAAAQGFQAWGHPGGYAGLQADQNAQEQQREKTLLAQAKQYRDLGEKRDQLNVESQRYQAESDWRERQANIQQQHYEDEARYQRAKELLDAQNKPPVKAGQGEAVFVNGQWIKPAGEKPQNLTNRSKTTVLYNGKPTDVLEDLDPQSKTVGHQFLSTGEDVTGKTSHYEKPKDTAEQDAGRFDRSYQYHSGEISKIETKADEYGARLSNLRGNLDAAANNPQAQALIIPQLVAAMAGGQGSGVRINEAELNRTEGGRSNWESALAWLQKFNTDPQHAGSLTPSQLKQMDQILSLVEGKHNARNKALSDARNELVTAKDEMGHRTAFQNLRTRLQGIESGAQQADTRRVRVRNKATGQTGTISESAFDSNKYERIQQ